MKRFPWFVVLLVVLAGGLFWLLQDTSEEIRPARNGPIGVEIFFPNIDADPSGENCKQVFPVKRQVQNASTIARETLQRLLEGPSAEESADGFVTAINSGVEILGLDIENGVARVNLSEELDRGVAGACRVAAIRAQLEATLSQFDTVDEVEIRVEGRDKEILQP